MNLGRVTFALNAAAAWFCSNALKAAKQEKLIGFSIWNASDFSECDFYSWTFFDSCFEISCHDCGFYCDFEIGCTTAYVCHVTSIAICIKQCSSF